MGQRINHLNPVYWFSVQCLAIILHLAASWLSWLHEVLHYVSTEHTLEGGQSTRYSFGKPADVINHSAVALVCSAWVNISNQAAIRGPKLEMMSSVQQLQCPVADVSWNWVTFSPLPPAVFWYLGNKCTAHVIMPRLHCRGQVLWATKPLHSNKSQIMMLEIGMCWINLVVLELWSCPAHIESCDQAR